MAGNGAQLAKLTSLIESGVIRPVVDRVFRFERTNEALAYVETGRAKGKVPSATPRTPRAKRDGRRSTADARRESRTDYRGPGARAYHEVRLGPLGASVHYHDGYGGVIPCKDAFPPHVQYYVQAIDDVSFLVEIGEALVDAGSKPPGNYSKQMGWVLIALQNAFWQLLHAESLEQGIVSTVMSGGDTDTNAAIAGALLGAVYGRNGIPLQWLDRILSCRPISGVAGVRHPRPEAFWPVDALWIAERLLWLGGKQQTD